MTESTELLRADFNRPETGPVFKSCREFSLSGLPAWQSNGGPTRSHPARINPFSIELAAPPQTRRVELIGVFALFAEREFEAPGTIGATVQAVNGDVIVFRQDLVNGLHYRDLAQAGARDQANGDGTTLRTIGTVEVGDREFPVDVLSIDLTVNASWDTLRIRDLGSPASFLIFDIFFHAPAAHGCPFHRTRGVPLDEVGAALRLGDRVKFQRAYDQLRASLGAVSDLDEARGQLLTFHAIVAAASLEFGGGREMHWSLLELARDVEKATQASELLKLGDRYITPVADAMLGEASGPSGYLIEQALAYIDRNFAKDLTDSHVARELGLSTSHFRFLFRQATGQPFQKYLTGLRLEKAKRLLMEQKVTVSTAAATVGFSGLAHFSRAFHQRFQMSPSAARRS